MATSVQYQPITPTSVYAGLKTTTELKGKPLADILLENTSSDNNYMDLFARLVRKHGKQSCSFYARLLGVETRELDGAIRCMGGMSIHDWMIEYLRLVVCDLLSNTQLSFKEIGKLLGMSSSSFSQFFQAYQHMQPYQFRSLKQHNLNRGYHLP